MKSIRGSFAICRSRSCSIRVSPNGSWSREDHLQTWLYENTRSRSGTAARAPLPLRRPHVRHRDLRARLPATPPANRASHGNQDRYLMSASTISRIIAYVPRWSSTRDAAARLSRRPAHLRQPASPTHSDGTAHSKPITRSGAHNDIIPAPHWLLPARHPSIKSP
jgi:hypothetical protein